MSVRARQLRSACRIRRGREVEGVEDPARQLGLDLVARGTLDDEAGDHVVRTRIRRDLRRAGREAHRTRGGDLDEAGRRPVVAEVTLQVRREHIGIPLVVGETARVVEELADRDLAAVRDETGKPALDGVAQAKLALCHELQHDCRDVRLRQARDAVPVGRLHRRARRDLGHAGGQPRRFVAVAYEEDHAGGAGGDECIDVLLQRGRRGHSARGADGDSRGDDGSQDGARHGFTSGAFCSAVLGAASVALAAS